MQVFRDLVAKLELNDLLISGTTYTLRNFVGTKSKIDRFLSNVDLMGSYHMALMVALGRPFSDHTPLVWESREGVTVRTYFKFQKSWLKEEGFREMVASWWASREVEGLATQ
jgi:hypothetical protein